jgi:lipid-A-disaccharide synthase
MAMTTITLPTKTLRLFIVSGEHSGDALGASLVRELRRRGYHSDKIEILGVGGEHLATEGMASLFPQSDIAVMGVAAVIGRLPLLARRISETVKAVIEAKPDLLLTIDSPDFGLRVAARVRKQDPAIPTVHWVCPSVWAWRPWRARAMRPYIDRILALLPFEPKALAELGGPPTVFVGHPLIEQLAELRPSLQESVQRGNADAPEILLLPGSRRSEISRLLPLFGDVAGRVAALIPGAHFVLPTVPHLEQAIRDAAQTWQVVPEIVTSHMQKRAAFRRARVALAASGTVTLELALSGVPTVAAYRVSAWEAMVARRVVRVPSVLLPNLILESRAMPEFLQQDATVDNLVQALMALVPDGAARHHQLGAFAELEKRMMGHPGSPSEHVADAILDMLATSSPTSD